jgi:hypothetical protein
MALRFNLEGCLLMLTAPYPPRWLREAEPSLSSLVYRVERLVIKRLAIFCGIFSATIRNLAILPLLKTCVT